MAKAIIALNSKGAKILKICACISVLFIILALLKRDSHKLRDSFFRPDIRPEKVHTTRVSYVSTKLMRLGVANRIVVVESNPKSEFDRQ